MKEMKSKVDQKLRQETTPKDMIIRVDKPNRPSLVH